jgi:hypothetical protein
LIDVTPSWFCSTPSELCRALNDALDEGYDLSIAFFNFSLISSGVG